MPSSFICPSCSTAGNIPSSMESRRRRTGLMAQLCEGRVALVTGAGRGIGREHALLLARHGAKVVVNDLGGGGGGAGEDLSPAQSVVDEIVAGGGEAIVDGGDVADFGAAEAMVARAIEAFGRLDVVVNNAGI